MNNEPAGSERAYTLTPHHFARARAAIERRRNELVESHAAALAAIAGHEAALHLIDRELANINDDERLVREIAARFAAHATSPAPAKKSKRHKVLTRKRREPTTIDTVRPPMIAVAAPDTEAKDEEPVVDSPTDAAFMAAPSDQFVIHDSRRAPPPRARVVRGLTDDGPEHPRELDRIAFASSRPE